MRAVWSAVAVVLSLLCCSALCLAQAPPPLVLADFETDAELAQWVGIGQIIHCPDGYCDPLPATISRVTGHATSGASSCELQAPPVDYSGMQTWTFLTPDWSAYNTLCLDVENPLPIAITMTVELSDTIHGNGWVNRATISKALVPGLNHMKIGLQDLPTNGGGQVDIAHTGVMSVFFSGFSGTTTFYCDYIRLEQVQDDPFADAQRDIWKFDCGTGDSPVWPDFFSLTQNDAYPVDAATMPFGWSSDNYRYSGDFGGPDNMARDFVRPLPCCPEEWNTLDFRLDLPNDTYTVWLIARSGNLSSFPVLDWSIAVEGQMMVDVPMDSAMFYTTDYYYRGINEDYPLSTSAWDLFEDAEYPAYSFTVTVSDGALDLSLLHAWLFGLVVYPSSLASEMEPRLAELDAQRQAQFESAYFINPPQSLTFTPTAGELARGFAAWPIASMDPVLPDSLPPDPRPALALNTSVVPGERRPVSLALRPVVDLQNVTVQVSALSDGQGHVLPASAVTPEYVRYLPTPDAEFFGSGVLTWKPRLVQDDFPINIPAQVSKQLWLEVQVPTGAVGGAYSGTVTVSSSAGQAVIPLALQVWPIQLDSADNMAYGWYYADPSSVYCFGYFPDMGDASDAMLRADLTSMREHGFNSLQLPGPICTDIDPVTGHVGTLDATELERYAAAMRDTGFGGTWPGQWVTLGVADSIVNNSSVTEFDPNFDAAYQDVLGRMETWSNSASGIPLVEWLLDEPRESMLNSWNRNFADTMEYAALANAVPGVQTTVTVMSDGDGAVDYTPFATALDIMQTHAWPQSAGLISGASAQGKPNWFYNTGGDMRLVYGFYNYAWAPESGGGWQWHFNWPDEGFDPFPYSPFNNHWRYVYPSPDGPVPTLRYEWASQGIWDYRYAATLDRVKRDAQAIGTPEALAWASGVQSLLDELKTRVPQFAVDNNYRSQHFAGIPEAPGCLTLSEQQLDSYRQRVAEAILSWPFTTDGTGLYDPSAAQFVLSNDNAAGAPDLTFTYGQPGAKFVALAGDWNGDGVDTVAQYAQNTATFFLRNSNSAGPADLTFAFGPKNAAPIRGDWDGDGVDTIGVYATNTGVFSLRNTNSAGPADLSFTINGRSRRLLPLAGDWNGDGLDTVGLYDPATSTFYLRNANSAGPADIVVTFGAGAGLLPIAGDWDADGVDTIGLYDPATGAIALRNSSTNGAADLTFTVAPALKPLAANWDGE